MDKMEFTDWLEGQLQERSMNRADLARASGLSNSQITRILNGEQGLGAETIVSIAKAIGKPPEEVFRQVVGLSKPERDPLIEEIEYLLIHMSSNGKREARNYVRYLAREESEEI